MVVVVVEVGHWGGVEFDDVHWLVGDRYGITNWLVGCSGSYGLS